MLLVVPTNNMISPTCEGLAHSVLKLLLICPNDITIMEITNYQSLVWATIPTCILYILYHTGYGKTNHFGNDVMTSDLPSYALAPMLPGYKCK